MPARRIGSGVVKSGSPIVRLMTSFISASMSKKRRMPDGGISRTRSLRKSAVARRVAGWLVIGASLATLSRELDERAAGLMAAVGAFAGLDPDRQPIRRPGQRAGRVGREDAGRVVGHVEVDDDGSIGLRRERVEIAPSAVAVDAVRRVR